MPEKLFFNTAIGVSLWFVSKDRGGNGHRKREGEVLFIDARKIGSMTSRRLRELTNEDIANIAGTYHSWRNEGGGYQDVLGYAKAASREQIAKHDFTLTPGRYVGAKAAAVDAEPMNDKVARLTAELIAEFDRGQVLEASLRERLDRLNG